VPRGPADRAGLKAGDRVLKVAGVKVESLPQLPQALANHKPGEVVAVEVDRGGKTVTVNVELGSQAD
jgi:S1-C subfamily serine protease